MKKLNIITASLTLVLILLFACKKNKELSIVEYPLKNISDGPSLIDIDGNQYNTVVINSQTWTTSNLKVSKYRNGDTIPEVQDSITWSTLTTGAWSRQLNYDDDLCSSWEDSKQRGFSLRCIKD